jgi:RyR domain
MLTVADIARVCHDANRALCTGLADCSQYPWLLAPVWQRESAIANVKWRLDNPGATPAAQHDAWCADKLAAGWRFGPMKDEGRKEHSSLVPYDQLPPTERAKDALFGAIVEVLKPLLLA